MIKRVKDMKSPLPSFSACAVQDGSGSQMSYNYNYAALIAEHRVCSRYRRDDRECVAWETVPARYMKGTRCRVFFASNRTPRYCVGTYRYVDVFVDGVKAGDTYYWR